MKEFTKSQIIGILYLSTWIILNVFSLMHAIDMYPYIRRENLPFHLLAPVVIDLIWLLIGLNRCVWHKTKDISLARSIFCFAILIIFTFLFKTVFYKMSDYMIAARQSNSYTHIIQIQQAIQETIDEMNPSNASDADLGESYNKLVDGCDIVNWPGDDGDTHPCDEFSQRIADKLNISEFYELKYWVYNTEPPAILYVKIEDGTAYITISNALPWKRNPGRSMTYPVVEGD